MPTSPSTNTKTNERTWKSVCVAADPEFEAAKRNEPEYELSNGRVFTANRSKRHPYNIDP